VDKGVWRRHAMLEKSRKEGLEPWKNEKEKNGKVRKNREMYMKNNGTYFNLDKWIFCTTVSVFVPLIKGKV
jgi:hypothetical protein